MRTTTCPNIKGCPIFKKGVLVNDYTEQTYKKLYCLNADNFPNCKRYIASQQIKGVKVPESIMPNSNLSISKIVEKMMQ